MTRTDHEHTTTDHGPTSMGGTWERCPCGHITITNPDGTTTHLPTGITAKSSQAQPTHSPDATPNDQPATHTAPDPTHPTTTPTHTANPPDPPA